MGLILLPGDPSILGATTSGTGPHDGLHQHLTGNLFFNVCFTVYLQNQIGDSLQNFASVVNFFGRTGLTVWPFSTTKYVLWVLWTVVVSCFGFLDGVAYHCSVLFLGVLGLSWVLPGVPHQRTWLRNGGKKEANKNRWWHDRFWPWQLCFVHLPQVFWPTLSSAFFAVGWIFLKNRIWSNKLWQKNDDTLEYKVFFLVVFRG